MLGAMRTEAQVQNELCMSTENKLMAARGHSRGEGAKEELGINIYTLLYIK